MLQKASMQSILIKSDLIKKTCIRFLSQKMAYIHGIEESRAQAIAIDFACDSNCSFAILIACEWHGMLFTKHDARLISGNLG